MTDEYFSRLARDIRLRYGEFESAEFCKVVNEFETEVIRAIRERSTFAVLTTPQAVALWAVLHEAADAVRYYRERAAK